LFDGDVRQRLQQRELVRRHKQALVEQTLNLHQESDLRVGRGSMGMSGQCYHRAQRPTGETRRVLRHYRKIRELEHF
jgi:hypothetical protein